MNDPRRLRPWRAKQWLVFGAVLIAALTALVASARQTPAHADLQRYSAVAAAHGMHDSVVSKDAPLSEQPVDIGVPSAQSLVDGLGASLGYAAAPYPGDTVLATPGLVASVLCANAEYCDGLPGFPLIASTSDPSKNDDLVEAGAFRLVAHSTPTTSNGDATAGGTAQANSVGRLRASATSKGEPATSLVSAESTSSAEVISVAGVLRIGRVLATAKAELAPDGKIKKTSSLAVTGASVSGQAVEITDKGIEIAGQKTPLPVIEPLESALKAAGITVRVVKPTETATGVESGAVVVTQNQEVSGRPAVHTYTFGAARANVVAVQLPPVTTPNTGPPLTETPTSGGTTVTPGTPATAGSTIPGTPSRTVPGPTVAQAPTTALPLRGVAAFTRMWTAQFYLILVVTGLVILGGARLTTTLAVRRTWTS
jgi:hypothetical protein